MRARGPGGDPQHLLFSNGKKSRLCHCFVSICQHFKKYFMETIVLLKCIWKCQQLWHWLLKHWITQYITSIGKASWFQLMNSHKVVINFGTRDWLCGCSHDEPSRNRDFTLLQFSQEHWYHAGFLNSRQPRLLKAHEEDTLILVEIFPLTEVS